jgi:hypothetical protein
MAGLEKKLKNDLTRRNDELLYQKERKNYNTKRTGRIAVLEELTNGWTLKKIRNDLTRRTDELLYQKN